MSESDTCGSAVNAGRNQKQLFIVKQETVDSFP